MEDAEAEETGHLEVVVLATIDDFLPRGGRNRGAVNIFCCSETVYSPSLVLSPLSSWFIEVNHTVKERLQMLGV